MRNLRDILEGFFNNVKASPMAIIKPWLSDFISGKKHFDITIGGIGGLFANCELFIDEEEGFIEFINPKKGPRTGVKIDICKDWGICWKDIYEESKVNPYDLNRVYLVCRKPFTGGTGGRIYIHPYDRSPRVYVYEVNTRKHTATFLKVMESGYERN